MATKIPDFHTLKHLINIFSHFGVIWVWNIGQLQTALFLSDVSISSSLSLTYPILIVEITLNTRLKNWTFPVSRSFQNVLLVNPILTHTCRQSGFNRIWVWSYSRESTYQTFKCIFKRENDDQTYYSKWKRYQQSSYAG